jgi:dTDP-4-dehydrorhamnose 3,5-epimerase-like enzyme
MWNKEMYMSEYSQAVPTNHRLIRVDWRKARGLGIEKKDKILGRGLC